MCRRCEQEGSHTRVADGTIDACGEAEIILARNFLAKLVIVEQGTERMEAYNPLNILGRVDSVCRPDRSQREPQRRRSDS